MEYYITFQQQDLPYMQEREGSHRNSSFPARVRLLDTGLPFAAQRRQPTSSPSNGTDNAVIKSGPEKKMAIMVLYGKAAKAIKKKT